MGEAIKHGTAEGLELNKAIKARNHIVAQRLLKLRKQKRYTQSEICVLIGVSRITYQGYEAERSSPTVEALVRLADFYNVSLDFISGRTDNANGIDFKKSEKNAIQSELAELQARSEELTKRIKELSEE